LQKQELYYAFHPLLFCKLRIATMRLTTVLKAISVDISGATAVEYGLVVALVGATILGAIELLGGSISATLTIIANAVSRAA
jgi:pilus assembly protein Flp/PilA